MNLEPLQDYVLVECDPEKEKSAGGIVIPENVKAPLITGRVIATGPGVYQDGVFIDVKVSAGQQILFEQTAGLVVPSSQGMKEWRILKEIHLLCVIKD